MFPLLWLWVCVGVCVDVHVGEWGNKGGEKYGVCGNGVQDVRIGVKALTDLLKHVE